MLCSGIGFRPPKKKRTLHLTGAVRKVPAYSAKPAEHHPALNIFIYAYRKRAESGRKIKKAAYSELSMTDAGELCEGRKTYNDVSEYYTGGTCSKVNAAAQTEF